VTAARLRLVALAAALAPARAARLVGRLGGTDVTGAVARAAALAAAPRRARLAALAGALGELPVPSAALHPLLARLDLERRSRRQGDAARPPVRAATPARTAHHQ
jgi:hypothetical protein